MTKVIMHGYQGKMGRIICDLSNADNSFEIVAGVDKTTSVNIETFPTFDNIKYCDMPADVIIDFSVASAVTELVEFAVSKNIALVVCTTGLKEDTVNFILEASKNIPIFKSANMSLGINIMANVLSKISKILYDENFDIEIIEKHHNQKIDAPSGTAYLLADIIKNSIDESEYIFDRSKTLEKRKHNEIGIHAVRGGTIIGEHDVIFAGKDEVLEIKHTAYSKNLFAVGAIKAAKFLVGKKAGMYDMKDLMNEIIK